MDRYSFIDHIERLRAKPEHVRRRIAVGTASTVTGVVAAGWLIAIIVTGTLSISPSTSNNATLATAPETQQVEQSVVQTQSAFTQLLGAVGFANTKSAPPSISVINPSTSTPSDDASDQPTGGNQTVIPF